MAPKVAIWAPKWIHAEAFSKTFSSFVEKCKLCLDRAGAIGLEFPPLVFVLWASWGPLVARLFRRTIPKDTSTGTFDYFFRFVQIWGCPDPRLPFGAIFLVLFHIFVDVRKFIDFGALWAGAGGRGRGPCKLQILRF